MIKIKRLNENNDDNVLCWVYQYKNEDDPMTEINEFFKIGKSQKLSKIEIDILEEQKSLIIVYLSKGNIKDNIFKSNSYDLRFEACKLPDYYYFVDILYSNGNEYVSFMCDTIEGIKLIYKTFLETKPL